MAESTLSVLDHPVFPQDFTPTIDLKIQSLFDLVEKVTANTQPAPMKKAVSRG